MSYSESESAFSFPTNVLTSHKLKQVRQQDTNLPYGGALPEGGYHPVTHIFRKPLSS